MAIGLLLPVIPANPAGLPRDSQGSKSAGQARTLFLEAEELNGLHRDTLKPFRLKVSFKLANPSGPTGEQGTIDELWGGPHLRKVVITMGSSSLTYFEVGKETYREGELNQKFALLSLLEKSFVDPVPYTKESLPDLDLSYESVPLGSATLPCFRLKVTRGVPHSFNDPTYCLESTQPILRVGSFADDPHEFIRTHVGKFQNCFVPIDISVNRGGKPDLTAHLESADILTSVNSGDFNPGASAQRLTKSRVTLVVSEAVLGKLIEAHRISPISRPEPSYPAVALAAHVRGTVEMRALIGTDGSIAALNVIRGPAELQQAALDAVWKWRFEPPLVDSGPAQILTEFAIRF